MNGTGHRADPSHFEVRASAARRATASYDWRSGASRFDPALRAPYEHVEGWFRTNAADGLVLDYGCGHGVHSIPPAVNGARVVGLDLSARSLAFARERAERARVGDRVRFVVGDGAKSPFADATFDHALAVDVLSYIEPRIAFAELARVLRPTGSLIVIDTLGHNPLLNLNRLLRGWRGERTPQEVRRVPRVEDIAVGREYFARAEMMFFDLLTPFIAAFHVERRRAAALARWLAAIDRRLLRRPALQPLAFKVVCTLSRPLRPKGNEPR